MRVGALLFLLSACGQSSKVECGEGTELKDGKCVASSVAVAPPRRDASIDAAQPSSVRAWQTRILPDAMRGTATVTTSIESDNAVVFDAPYGEARLSISCVEDPTERSASLLLDRAV
jgi:hypothetical protein